MGMGNCCDGTKPLCEQCRKRYDEMFDYLAKHKDEIKIQETCEAVVPLNGYVFQIRRGDKMEEFTTEDILKFQKGEAYATGRNGATVRIVLPDGTETALCTVTYSYKMSAQMRNSVAEQIASTWNKNRT